jgi:hypothetical protein
VDPSAARHCWDEPDATTFHVRGPDYLKTKVTGVGRVDRPLTGL